ncbi:hypothetical protein MHBO_005200 [Bonamia ostreae]|uniref:Uncharacterized protein n=1 Tax=Bonamia ostreae TaxID=126728 RepID=A0ABV2AV98_9EUKA
MNSAVESISKAAKELGYTIKMDMSGWSGKLGNEIEITLPDGTEKKINTMDHKDAMDQLMNTMSTIFNQPIGQPQTTDVVTGQTVNRGGKLYGRE